MEIARLGMAEIEAVGRALGAQFARSTVERLKSVEGFGAFKTSMLQDFERGRPIEIDALVGSVVELGALVGVATPTLAMLAQLARATAR